MVRNLEDTYWVSIDSLKVLDIDISIQESKVNSGQVDLVLKNKNTIYPTAYDPFIDRREARLFLRDLLLRDRFIRIHQLTRALILQDEYTVNINYSTSSVLKSNRPEEYRIFSMDYVGL